MSPEAITIALIAIVVMFALFIAYSLLTRASRTERTPGRHAIGTVPAPRPARNEFADPADEHDPEGDGWVQSLKDAGMEPPSVLPPVAPPMGMPWPVRPAQPVPAPVHHETAPAMATLERVKAGLLALPPAGLADAAADDPAPDATVRLPVEICELAGKTSEEFVDDLFAGARAELDAVFAEIDRAAEDDEEAAA